MPPDTLTATRADAAEELARARARTLRLSQLPEEALVRQHDPLLSPIVWDIAHIGQQEDLWLLRGGDAARPGMLSPEVDQLYDAFRHPRAERARLPLLGLTEALRLCAQVRERVLDLLDSAPDAFPYAMVAQHEQQHVETMLATVQIRDGAPILEATAVPPAPVLSTAVDRVLIPAGEFQLGVDEADEPWSLDNERPARTVDLPAFAIARRPVTNAQWRAFMADGGYEQPRWWSPRGWRHRVETGLSRPMYWLADGTRRRFGHVEEVPADEPVQHVTWFEAQAYAAWAGARLPTEQEWEKACVWDPAAGRRRRWPWGDAPPNPARANLDSALLRPAPVGSLPDGASAYGVEQLVGDVWEWTSSPFEPWPGFSPMLYATYSAPFFGGDFRVLRGGSWATAAVAARPSFRNWDHPVRRQIFTGVRLAWDV